MNKHLSIKVQDGYINIENDYICLTDMVKAGNSKARPADAIKGWLNNKSTIEFLGTWESLNNPNFKVGEFTHFREKANNQGFELSVSSWVEKTGAIGIYSHLGKYGGTYAHKDIAFEFGSAISPVFKLYLITEYQRLKELENNQFNIEWQIRRMLSKDYYVVLTDAVQQYKIPHNKIVDLRKIQFAYAEEGDILYKAIYDFTSKQWREANPDLAAKGENIRFYASTNELIVISTLSGMNAQLIKENKPYSERLIKLKEAAKEQLKSLNNKNPKGALRKNIEGEFQVSEPDVIFPSRRLLN